MKTHRPRKIYTLACTLVLVLVAIVPIRAQQASPAADPTKSPDKLSPSKVEAASESPPDVLVLSPFQVTADSNVGYGATHTSSAARVAQVYIDVPQTVNVVTSEFINDFNLKDQHRLLQYVPNVAVSQGSGLFIRGAPAGQVYVDGIVNNANLRGIPAQFYDRIEVVKGPSSAAFGLGEPAGVVNYLSKTANGTEQQRYEVGVGEYSSYQAEFDVQGRHAKNKNISYRMVGYWADGSGPIHNTQKYGGAGAQLALRYDKDPTLTFQSIVNFARDNTPFQSDQAWWFSNAPGIDFLAKLGLPRITPPVSKNANLTPSGWGNQISFDQFKMTVIVDKSLFDGKVNLRNALRIANSIGVGKYTTASNVYNPSPGVFETGVDLRDTSDARNAFTENIDLSMKHEVGGVKFQTIAGFNYRSSNGNSYGKYFLGQKPDGTPYRINMHNPDISSGFASLSSPGMVGTVLYNNQFSDEAHGFYLQEDVSFLKNDMITLSAGIRKDSSRAVNKNKLNNKSTDTGVKKPDAAPRYTFSFKPLPWLNVYALYAKHIDPARLQAKYGITVAGGPMSPADLARFENLAPVLTILPSGELKEAGVKATFLEGKITVTAAAFDESIGGATTNFTHIFKNPDGSTEQVVELFLVTKELKGYEIEVFGQPTKRLTLTAAIGTTKGTSVAGTGKNTDASPPKTASFHIRYDFGDLHGNGFYALLGGIHYGNFWIYQDRTNFALNTFYPDSQQSYDIGLGYKWKSGNRQNTIALTVNNASDAAISVGFDGNNYVTQPRRQAFLTYSISL